MQAGGQGFESPSLHQPGKSKNIRDSVSPRTVLCYALFTSEDRVASYESNSSDLRGSADYSASCGGATKHGISTANRFRPLKREQYSAATAFTSGPLNNADPSPVRPCQPRPSWKHRGNRRHDQIRGIQPDQTLVPQLPVLRTCLRSLK